MLGGTRIRLYSVRLSLVTGELCGSSTARNETKCEAFRNKLADTVELFINSGMEMNLCEALFFLIGGNET